MPIGLATFAAVLKREGYQTTVIDAFGEAPNKITPQGSFFYRGLTAEEVAEKIDPAVSALFLYAFNVTYHEATLHILRTVKKRFPHIPLIILENSQAVTAYSLRHVKDEFFEAGADFLVMGEPEVRAIRLLEKLDTRASEEISLIDGIASKTFLNLPVNKLADLDTLPWPAWKLFPIENYWKLGYAHGPLTSKKYLPIVTSRGCPYPCRFCIIPELNDTKWRARSARHVVDEMDYFQSTLGVSEFHFEDVDPTVSDIRTQEICREILRRGLSLRWKISSGTKVETIKSEETVDLMAQAGCKYISISPESGSADLMKLMKKPFHYEHAVKMVRRMAMRGIKTQACFVLGFPGETDNDRALTLQMVKDLVIEGLDEIAQFIITPVPGSAIYNDFTGYESLSELNFSPTWRPDYEQLNKFRVRLYSRFLLWKLRYHPFRFLRQPFNFIFGQFQTKMEMTPYRALHTLLLARNT